MPRLSRTFRINTADDNIPLSVLICDSNHGEASTLEEAIRRTGGILNVKSVYTLDGAESELHSGSVTTIFIDPLSFDLNKASSFIFATRASLPHIVFVLYIDKALAERRRAEFYEGERRRFSHYFELDKQTPIVSFADELNATLNSCRIELLAEISAAHLERLRQEAKSIVRAGPEGSGTQLADRLEVLLAKVTSALESKSLPRKSSSGARKVFLSYRFAEKDYVEGLTNLLGKSGFEVVTGQAANTYISKAVIERIKECDYFLCLMTPSARKDDGTYTTSPWLLEEKGVALAFEKQIVLMIEEGVTDFGGLQGDWQRLHFGSKGFLIAALQAVEQLKSYSGNITL